MIWLAPTSKHTPGALWSPCRSQRCRHKGGLGIFRPGAPSAGVHETPPSCCCALADVSGGRAFHQAAMPFHVEPLAVVTQERKVRPWQSLGLVQTVLGSSQHLCATQSRPLTTRCVRMFTETTLRPVGQTAVSTGVVTSPSVPRRQECPSRRRRHRRTSPAATPPAVQPPTSQSLKRRPVRARPLPGAPVELRLGRDLAERRSRTSGH